MADRITKLQRWLDLIAYLVGRRTPATVDELMEKIPAYARKWVDGDDTARDTVRRMFERDKDELKAAGIPLETVRYNIEYGAEKVDGYRIARRDFYLPYLKLVAGAAARGEGGDVGAPGEEPPRSAGGEEPAGAASPLRRATAARSRLERLEIPEDDAGVALDALGEASSSAAFPFAGAARSAFRKLAFDLDPDALRGDSPVLYVDPPGAAEAAATVRTLSDALLARKRVRFRYHGIYRGRTTDRDVAPYGLLFQRAHWYLVGHDAAREDLRVFRVGRMEDVEPNASAPKTPDYEIPESFRVSDYLDREAWELGDDEEPPLRARVRFRFPLSLWAERNGYGRPVEERADGSAVRAFDVQQVNPFLRWLLTFTGEAEVLEPPELADGLRALAREVAALYGAAGESGDAGVEADDV